MLFFWFGGGNLPPRLRRFLTGLTVSSVILFMLQIFMNIPFTEIWFTGALILFFAIWYAQRDPRKQQSQRFMNEESYDQGYDRGFNYRHDVEEDEAPRLRTSAKGLEAASRALRLAGHDPEEVRVRLHDIGLLVYKDDMRPVAIARDESVRADASHIRPFMQLESPLSRPISQKIVFELYDADGTLQFRDDAAHEVQPGANLITPKTWLPLRTANPDGRWTMQVKMGETPYAKHPFKWREMRPVEVRTPNTSAVKVPLKSDGEIEDRAALNRLSDNRPLSLEELLSELNTEDSTPSETSGRAQSDSQSI